MSLNNFTMGYLESSLEAVPSMKAAMDAYMEAASSIPGAKHVERKGLVGWELDEKPFPPNAAPVIAALTAVAAAAGGSQA